MTLPINYSELITLIIGIFAFVGIMRGWRKEGVTALFVAILATLAWQPDLARRIINLLNEIISFVIQLVRSILSGDPYSISSQAVTQKAVFDPDSYRFWTILAGIMVILSYLVGETSFQGRVPALGRILGGIFGACNGYILVALARQYLVNQARAEGRVIAQTGEFAIQVTNVPAQNIFAGYGIIFVFIVLVAAIALLIAGDRFNFPIK